MNRLLSDYLPRKAAWKHLIDEDDKFRRWHSNLARGSINTADLNARTLFRLAKLIELTPTEMVAYAKRNRSGFEDILFDFVSQLGEKNHAPSYIENYLKTVRSWLQFNEILLVRKINVGNTTLTPTIEDEKIPEKEELKQILLYAKDRGKCSISLMAFSGLRPEVLGYSNGLIGLELRDFPELEINGSEIHFSKIPTMVVVRAVLSKSKQKYFTFLGPEGCDYLKAYLEKRMVNGELLEPNSAIIRCKPGFEDTGLRVTGRSNHHITTKTVTKEIRDAMRPKYSWRPYVLRAYFDTQSLIAESKGKMTSAYRQFFMGHKGNIEARYTTNKGRLPTDLIEDMRDSYRRSLEYFETRKGEISEDKLRDALRRQLLLVAGFDGDEIDELNLSMADDDFQDIVRRKLVGSVVNNGNSQKVVNLDEVEGYIVGGWNYVDKLGEDRAIIKLP